MSQDDPQLPSGASNGPEGRPPQAWDGRPGYGANPQEVPPGYPAQPQAYPTAPQAYPGEALGYPPVAPKTPGIAIWGLVLAFLMAPVGLVLSIIALGKTKRAGAGRGLAVAGVIISSLALVSIAVAVPLVIKVIGFVGAPGDSVTRLYESVESGDCDEYMATTTADYRALFDAETCEDFALYSGDESGVTDLTVSVTNVNIENGRAEVVAGVSFDDSESGERTFRTATVQLISQGGDWLVDSDVFE